MPGSRTYLIATAIALVAACVGDPDTAPDPSHDSPTATGPAPVSLGAAVRAGRVEIDVADASPSAGFTTVATVRCDGEPERVSEQRGLAFEVEPGLACAITVTEVHADAVVYRPLGAPVELALTWSDSDLPEVVAKAQAPSITYVGRTEDDEPVELLIALSERTIRAWHPIAALGAAPVGAEVVLPAGAVTRYYAAGPVTSTPRAIPIEAPITCREQTVAPPNYLTLGVAGGYTVATLLGAPWFTGPGALVGAAKTLWTYTVNVANACPLITVGARQARFYQAADNIRLARVDDYKLYSSTNCRCKCAPVTGILTQSYCAIGEPLQTVPGVELVPIVALGQAPSPTCTARCGTWCGAQPTCTGVASAFALVNDLNTRVSRITELDVAQSAPRCITTTQEYNLKCGAVPTVGLRVTKAGAGVGTVTSAPAGINCGATCVASFAAGSMVTLTATPAAGSTFAGWSGACTGAGTTCTVTMTLERLATATFNVAPVAAALSVTRAGTGVGTVTSAPAGISCGAFCSTTFAVNSSVTLTATPAAGSTFAGWSGACTGAATTCTVTMSAARSVTATFNAAPTTALLTVTRVGTGTGTGTVTSAPAGINCGAACVASYALGTNVTLTATPAAGSTFVGWTGACVGAATTCTVAMTVARSVTATFNAAPTTALLTVSRAGPGVGTVTSAPGGINCGVACAASYAIGTNVTLTATPAAGSTFAGWGGACAGVVTTTCTVAMIAARSAVAGFNGAPTTAALTVSRTGTGFGTVTSAPAGINCGAACAASYALGTNVTLTATPAAGSRFTGWGGACAGVATTCTVAMTVARSAVAAFGPAVVFRGSGADPREQGETAGAGLR